MIRRTLVPIGFAALLLLAACSSSKSVGSETTVSAAPSESVAETVPGTDAPPTTAVEVTTSVADTSTTVAADTTLLLRDNGIGSFDLGAEVGPVVEGLTAALGAPTRDETVDYPVADGLGEYTTADGDVGFVAPMGRTVCWSISLCAEFGGGSAASMSFTGWTYSNDPTMSLFSESGGSVGVRWIDLPALQVDEGGCYSSGSGTIDGIRVSLESVGEPFSSFDDSGNYVTNVPAADDVTITSMETGKAPIYLYGDC